MQHFRFFCKSVKETVCYRRYVGKGRESYIAENEPFNGIEPFNGTKPFDGSNLESLSNVTEDFSWKFGNSSISMLCVCGFHSAGNFLDTDQKLKSY